ncbi:MAG: SpoVG family protein [Planctomycetales bacterium]|nr:SpoVG family protein [Planctomycetales bacterium]
MEITEVRVKLMDDPDEKLLAFCTVTLNNDFVVRDVKIIGGPRGPFVAMPSRKITDRCQRCRGKNHLRAKFCNECGGRLDETRADRDPQGRARLHADVAHPINQACRDLLQAAVLRSYEEERKRAGEAGYVPTRLDEFEETVPAALAEAVATPGPAAPNGGTVAPAPQARRNEWRGTPRRRGRGPGSAPATAVPPSPAPAAGLPPAPPLPLAEPPPLAGPPRRTAADPDDMGPPIFGEEPQG